MLNSQREVLSWSGRAMGRGRRGAWPGCGTVRRHPFALGFCRANLAHAQRATSKFETAQLALVATFTIAKNSVADIQSGVEGRSPKASRTARPQEAQVLYNGVTGNQRGVLYIARGGVGAVYKVRVDEGHTVFALSCQQRRCGG
jgi:hypothetical protein